MHFLESFPNQFKLFSSFIVSTVQWPHYSRNKGNKFQLWTPLVKIWYTDLFSCCPSGSASLCVLSIDSLTINVKPRLKALVNKSRQAHVYSMWTYLFVCVCIGVFKRENEKKQQLIQSLAQHSCNNIPWIYKIRENLLSNSCIFCKKKKKKKPQAKL